MADELLVCTDTMDRLGCLRGSCSIFEKAVGVGTVLGTEWVQPFPGTDESQLRAWGSALEATPTC